MKCRYCNNKNINPLFVKDDVPYFKCSRCHIWFSGKLLDNSCLKELYEYYSSSKSTVSKKINELRYDALFRKFEYYRKASRLLDVGCGRGDLIQTAKKKDGTLLALNFRQRQ